MVHNQKGAGARVLLIPKADIEPEFFNHLNRVQAEKTYLLTEAAPEFLHKGRILQAFTKDKDEINLWWLKVSSTVESWIEFAATVNVPVYEEVCSWRLRS